MISGTQTKSGGTRQGVFTLMLVACASFAWVIWLQQTQIRHEEQERLTNADRINWLQTADYWIQNPSESMPELLDCLSRKDPLARRSAGLALSRMGPAAREWLPEIMPLIDDQDPAVRQFALLCLSRLEIDLGPWTEPIAVRLADDDTVVREAAARAIAHVGILASPAVSRVLASCEPGRSAHLMTVLSHLGTDDSEALARIHQTLRDDSVDPKLRLVAFFTLRSIEQLDADDAAAGLHRSGPERELPSMPLSQLRLVSLRAISELHLTSPSLREAFMKFLAGQNERRRDGAIDEIPEDLTLISAAWILGVDQNRLVPRLVQIGSGRGCIRLLREMNRDEALKLLPGFLESASDLGGKDSWSGWSSLQGMGPDAAECLPLIIERLRLRSDSGISSWEWWRDEAFRMIEEIGPGSAGAVPDLIELISTRNSHRASNPSLSLDMRIFRALGAIGQGSREAVPVIVAWLNESHPELQSKGNSSEPLWSPLDALRRIGTWDPDVAECLARLRGHEEPKIREAALLALAELAPDHSHPVSPLVAALDDPHYLVRRAAASALGHLGHSARGAVPALRQAAHATANAIPPEVVFLGDEQILILDGLQGNYWTSPGTYWPVSVRQRTVREAALEAIQQIEGNPNP